MKKNLFLSFILICFLMFAYAPKASAATSTNRIAGYDRYQTAVAASQSGWPDGADSAILAYGENFPDALSAGPLAHKYNAPILLTSAHSLNSDTAVELKRLKVKKVYIIGGSAVVSVNVEKQLSLMKIVFARIAGQDRYDTALKVAQEVGVSKGVFVTTGMDFPDALSIGPIAAANEMPILLVPPNDLTANQKDFLNKNKIPATFIVGGSTVLNDKIIQQFPNYEVISGTDSYERNINLIKRFADSLDLDTIYIATGENFPDALASSALAQKNKHPILLLKGNTLSVSLLSFMRSTIISKLHIMGGTNVIYDSTESTLATLPAQIASVADVNDSILEQQTFEPPKTVTVTKTNGLKEEVPVTWSLSTVQTLRAGTYQFEGTLKNYRGYVYLNLTVHPIVTKIDPISAEIILGDYFNFPDIVGATMSDGSAETFPVTWSSSIVPLNKVGTYTFQGTIKGLTQKASLTLKVSEDSKISFPDLALKAAVGDKLDKDMDETIYKSDVLDITSLYASSEGISDLTGLEYFTNLKTLDLRNNSLTKTTSLGKLINLKTLKLNDTELVDLTPLASLTSLTYLDISDNHIVDFSSLKYLTKLTTLYLEDNVPLTPPLNYTPDYSSVRSYYKNLDKKDFSL